MYKEDYEDNDVYEPVVESASSDKDSPHVVLAECKGDHQDESKVTSWKELHPRRRRILYLLSDIWITVRRWLFPTDQHDLVVSTSGYYVRIMCLFSQCAGSSALLIAIALYALVGKIRVISAGTLHFLRQTANLNCMQYALV